MRYRRLGRTELMVSEVGLDADALRDAGHDEAVAVVRAALASGVTLVTWSVADSLEDIEPWLAEGARSEIGRFTLIPRLDVLPSPEAIGPQVEAVAARLGVESLPVAAFPEVPVGDAAAALAEVRERGVVRFAGYAGTAPLQPAQAAAVDVVVMAAWTAPPSGLGAVMLASSPHREAQSTALPLASVRALDELLRG